MTSERESVIGKISHYKATIKKEREREREREREKLNANMNNLMVN
jgi:hypothetical protein